jgi:hypothetical protein
VNQCLETYLRCFVQACPTKWKRWISLAEYWYNTSYHSSLRLTPFEVLYGQSPNQLGLDIREICTVPALQDWLNERKLMIQLVQQQLHRAQQRQKRQADKNRSERSFSVGDRVYLKLQPYVQSSLARRANHKLAFKYFGPYEISAKVGAVAYKLDLPPSSSIHPVFHVSLLKRAIGNSVQVSSALPLHSDSLQWPEFVLQRRVQHKPTGDVSQLLIKWSSWSADLATWEDEDAIKKQFPDAPAWGQAVSKGGEYVTPPRTELAPRRSSRIGKPSTRYLGPDWKA